MSTVTANTKPSTNGADPWVVDSQSAVARFFRVNRSTVGEWVSAGMPHGQRRYDLSEILAWKQSRARDQQPEPTNGAGLHARKKAAEVAILEAKAKALVMANAEAAGDLVSRADVLTDTNELLSIIQAWVENWPEDIRCVLPAEVQAAVVAELGRRVFLLLTYLSRWQPLDTGKLPPETGVREAGPHVGRLHAFSSRGCAPCRHNSPLLCPPSTAPRSKRR